MFLFKIFFFVQRKHIDLLMFLFPVIYVVFLQQEKQSTCYDINVHLVENLLPKSNSFPEEKLLDRATFIGQYREGR